MIKKRVFISGITGTMGKASMKHLMKDNHDLEFVSIVRESEKNKELVKQFNKEHIDIVWGDLRDYIDVKNALKGVNMIVHIAAFVSPEADFFPRLAWEINVGSVKNILRAIDELELDNVKLVYIGSVAQTGSRLPPIHWGRVGDPIKASQFDNYAASKSAAERLIIESGLKYWVSLRQTGILHKGLLDIRDGIIFHQPLNNVLEWITEDDSGRLIANLCTKDLPDSFWKRVYNIGGGERCRLNNYDFMSKIMSIIGVKDIKKIFEANWFATKNFHGHYYLDSDILNQYLDFRREGIDDFIKRIEKEELKLSSKLLKFFPSTVTRNLIMKRIAKGDHGSLQWINAKDDARIKAFWGSLDERKKVKDWDKVKLDVLDQVLYLALKLFRIQKNGMNQHRLFS